MCIRDSNDTIMSELQILQNKAAKVMLGQPPRSSSTEALKSLDLKSLSTRRFFIAALQSTSVLLEKPISTLILLKLKLFIHVIQDALMIFAYRYPEQTGVNKLLFFTPRKIIIIIIVISLVLRSLLIHKKNYSRLGISVRSIIIIERPFSIFLQEVHPIHCLTTLRS